MDPAGLVARARSLWRGMVRRDGISDEIATEFRSHLELRAADLVRSGMSASEAARQARLEFGSSEEYRARGAEARGLRGFDVLRVSWLDFKLGFRMLAKYPGLTLVGGLAIAFAIAVGTATFEFVSQLLDPTIPLADGRRIVGIQNWDVAARRTDLRALHDFVAWRRELKSIGDVGAFRTVARNLIAADGRGEPIDVAEITASAFRLGRVHPLLGRALVESDEQLGSAPVVVIGYDVWRTRFASDGSIIGRTLRLGETAYTIVGVMPEGFAFPVSHSIWVPLRLDVTAYERGKIPAINVVGRLSPGATLASAQAEVTGIGNRTSTDFPKTHEHLQPRVMPFAASVVPLPELGTVGLMSVNVFFVMLVCLVCANIALLMFARAATRESEIAVRTALGATRGRIVGQLVAEALVLGAVAGVAGLIAARFALAWWMNVSTIEAGGCLPFWFNHELRPATIAYAIVLAIMGAFIMGVLPALKVTEGGVEARLRQAASLGGGLRFGGVWTAIIVAQVAITVAFPATAFFAGRYVSRMQSLDLGVPAAEYLTASFQSVTTARPATASSRQRMKI